MIDLFFLREERGLSNCSDRQVEIRTAVPMIVFCLCRRDGHFFHFPPRSEATLKRPVVYGMNLPMSELSRNTCVFAEYIVHIEKGMSIEMLHRRRGFFPSQVV